MPVTTAHRGDTSTSTRTSGSREDKLAALHEQISAGVDALASSDAWRAMLEVAAKFHTYSVGNLLLITSQRPDATCVAGFRRWQSLGRQVRKGEKGIAILAPCVYRPKQTDSDPDDHDGNNPAASRTGPQETQQQDTHPARRRVGFRVAHVFDISQTDGEPLPEPVAPELLTGQAPEGLWDGLAAKVAAHGYTLERGDCRGANGYTDPATRVVRVRADVDDAHAVKTLAHELGHIECGHVTDAASYLFCRGRCEVEAESVAYVVAASNGMDTGGYTFAYVAGWAGGDAAKVRATADTVLTAVRRILDTAPGAAYDEEAAREPVI